MELVVKGIKKVQPHGSVVSLCLYIGNVSFEDLFSLHFLSLKCNLVRSTYCDSLFLAT